MGSILLTELSIVKSILKMDAGEVKYDALLNMLITSVSKFVETSLLQRFSKTEARTTYFDIRSDYDDSEPFSLFLPAWPISALSGIWNDADRVFAGSPIDPSYYVISSGEEGRGKVEIDGIYLDAGVKSLKVVWTGGLGTDYAAFKAAYPDIAYAVGLQVALNYKRGDNLDLVSQNIQSMSTTFEKNDVHPMVKQFLIGYARDPNNSWLI